MFGSISRFRNGCKSFRFQAFKRSGTSSIAELVRASTTPVPKSPGKDKESNSGEGIAKRQFGIHYFVLNNSQ